MTDATVTVRFSRPAHDANILVVYIIINAFYIMSQLILFAYPTNTSKYCIHARQCARLSLRVLGSYCVLETQTRSTALGWYPVRYHECACTTDPNLLFKIRPLKIRGFILNGGHVRRQVRAFKVRLVSIPVPHQVADPYHWEHGTSINHTRHVWSVYTYTCRRFVLITRFYPRIQDKCIASNSLDCIGLNLYCEIEIVIYQPIIIERSQRMEKEFASSISLIIQYSPSCLTSAYCAQFVLVCTVCNYVMRIANTHVKARTLVFRRNKPIGYHPKGPSL